MTDEPRETEARPGSARGEGDPALDETSRSAAACPRCGAHRLATLDLPTIDTTGFRPLDEIYGMTGGPSLEEPAIGCLACGAEWPDLAAFNEEASGRGDHQRGT
ncbi:MAG TPA: hypothetical protein VGJ17_06970 [Candidatus Limnocylindrales bacterium]